MSCVGKLPKESLQILFLGEPAHPMRDDEDTTHVSVGARPVRVVEFHGADELDHAFFT